MRKIAAVAGQGGQEIWNVIGQQNADELGNDPELVAALKAAQALGKGENADAVVDHCEYWK